jgi:hypothetical protein
LPKQLFTLIKKYDKLIKRIKLMDIKDINFYKKINFLILIIIFMLYSCINKDKNYVDINCIIINNTNEKIYYGKIGISSVTFFDNEKIYYLSFPVYFESDSIISFHNNSNYLNALEPKNTKELKFSLKNEEWKIDLLKYSINIDENGNINKVYEGLCSTVSFILYYTKEPVENTINNYGYYKRTMMKKGYLVKGFMENNIIYFNIDEEIKIK